MAPKKASVKKPILPAIEEAKSELPLPPPPRDPSIPLTFEELWFDADNEIEGEEQKQLAQDLKKHITEQAVAIRQYLEESNMVALLLQALQHLIVDRPHDPFRYLAQFFRDEGPKIEAELERCRQIDAQKRAKRAAADQTRLDAERAAQEAGARAKRAAEAAALAAAAAAAQAAKEAKALADTKATAQAAAATFKANVAAAAAVKPSPTVEKKKEPEKPAGPKKTEWRK